LICVPSQEKKKSDIVLNSKLKKMLKNVKNVELKIVNSESMLFSDLMFLLKRVTERKKIPYNIPKAKRGSESIANVIVEKSFFFFRIFYM